MAPINTILNEFFTISICNRTDQHLFSSSPSASFSFEAEKAHLLPRSFNHITCQCTAYDEDIFNQVSIEMLDERGALICNVSMSLSSNSKWKPVITSSQSIRALSRSISPSAHQLLILPKRDCATFLSSLDDSICLTSLCLAGTHDSLSLYGWPISSCQSSDSSVTKQLNDGIRYLDIRLAPKGLPGKERLLAYHGITDQRIAFSKVLEESFDFLNGIGRNETIVMSLKQESGSQDLFIKLLFSKYVDQSPASPDGRHQNGRHRWFLEDRVPILGEARGKIIMLSRFVIDKSYNFAGGISPPIWPNNSKAPFEYRLRSSMQRVQTQDWYSIGNLSHIPEKMSLIKEVCQDGGIDDDTFALNYCNGCTFPFALPPAVAKGFLDDGTKSQQERYPLTNLMATQGVNSSLREYIVDILFQSHQARGTGEAAVNGLKVTWALDFYNEPKGAADLVSLLIEANF